MFGDAVDASAVAGQDRGLADVLLGAADVPGASATSFCSPVRLRLRGARAERAPPPCPALDCALDLAVPPGGEKAAEKRVACARRVVRLERLDWDERLRPVARKPRRLSRHAFRCATDGPSAPLARRPSRTKPASPRLDTTMSARAASARGEIGRHGAGVGLHRPDDRRVGARERQRLARRLLPGRRSRKPGPRPRRARAAPRRGASGSARLGW